MRGGVGGEILARYCISTPRIHSEASKDEVLSEFCLLRVH